MYSVNPALTSHSSSDEKVKLNQAMSKNKGQRPTLIMTLLPPLCQKAFVVVCMARKYFYITSYYRGWTHNNIFVQPCFKFRLQFVINILFISFEAICCIFSSLLYYKPHALVWSEPDVAAILNYLNDQYYCGLVKICLDKEREVQYLHF